MVSSTVASAPDEVARLMRRGGTTESPHAATSAGRLIADDLVAPVNTDLIPSYSQLFPAIKHQPDNTVDGLTYGVPNGRLANLFIWEPGQVAVPSDEPVSSNLIFDPSMASRYRGSVTAYGNPMYIADAALYLRNHDPDLGIHDIYELDQAQFDAALGLLREQRPNVGRYWTDSAQNVKAFGMGTASSGRPGR